MWILSGSAAPAGIDTGMAGYTTSGELADLIREYRNTDYRTCPTRLAEAFVEMAQGLFKRYGYGNWYHGTAEDFGHEVLIFLLGNPVRKVDLDRPGRAVFNYFTTCTACYAWKQYHRGDKERAFFAEVRQLVATHQKRQGLQSPRRREHCALVS